MKGMSCASATLRLSSMAIVVGNNCAVRSANDDFAGRGASAIRGSLYPIFLELVVEICSELDEYMGSTYICLVCIEGPRVKIHLISDSILR